MSRKKNYYVPCGLHHTTEDDLKLWFRSSHNPLARVPYAVKKKREKRDPNKIEYTEINEEHPNA